MGGKEWRWFWQDAPKIKTYDKDDTNLKAMEAQLSRIQADHIAAQQADQAALQALQDKGKAQKASEEASLKQSQKENQEQAKALAEKSQAELKSMQAEAAMQHQRTLDQLRSIQAEMDQKAAQLEAQRQAVADLLRRQRVDFEHQLAQMQLDLKKSEEVSAEAHQEMKKLVEARTKMMMDTIKQTESDQAEVESSCKQVQKNQVELQKRTVQVTNDYTKKIEAQRAIESQVAEQAGVQCSADSIEGIRLSEKFGNASKQSVGVQSKSVTQQQYKVLLSQALQHHVTATELKEMWALLDKSSNIANSFTRLVNGPRPVPQASSAKGSFVLGTGCSEVCPLIAFLQGSMSADKLGRTGACKGSGVDSAHPKVTYQFCFDQTDPSKMKVVSFAPHVHSG